MITDEQIENKEVKEGTKIYYTRKDGSRVYGVVRNIYPEKRMLSMKPDTPIDIKNNNTYPQTFRFRRLTVVGGIDVLGIQVAPLVIMAASSTTPEVLKRIYTCKEGMFITDSDRVYMEKVRGLSSGYMNDEINGIDIFRIAKDELKRCVYDETMFVREPSAVPVNMYLDLEIGETQAYAMVDRDEFNKSVRAIPYSGGYWTKGGDWIDIKMVAGEMTAKVYDRNKNLCSTNKIAGLIHSNGKACMNMKLFHLKDMARGLRTKEYMLNFTDKNMLAIDTVEQRRIQFNLDGWQELKKEMVLICREDIEQLYDV
jgi:hypothetical protein